MADVKNNQDGQLLLELPELEDEKAEANLLVTHFRLMQGVE